MTTRRTQLALTSLALVIAAGTSACVTHVTDERDQQGPQITRPDGSGDVTDGDSDSGDSTVEPGSRLVWVLIHPSEAPDGPGIFLFDEEQQQVLAHLDLPAQVESPHALAYDGTSLWLGEMGPQGAIYELDPVTGDVRSTIAGVRTEGIAVDGDTLWYAGEDPSTLAMSLMHIRHDGTVLDALPMAAPVVQDLTFDGTSLYYLINDDLDRVLRVDPVTGAESPLLDHVFVAPYALAFDGQHLAVAADGTVKRYDPVTGAQVSSGPLGVAGWISAIAFAAGAP